jgi:glycosyltransferase involved in cell wall biosynthesis
MSKPAASPLLLSVFSTFKVGGPQVRFCALANHFGKRYRHVIIAMDGALDCKERLSCDLDVNLLAVENHKGDTFGNRRRFRHMLRELRPDCLVTYNWGSIEWAMANWPILVPHVHIEDGFGPEEAHRQLWRRVLTRRLLLRRSTLVVPSKQLERLASQVWKLKPKRLHYIPNGIDCARFADPAITPLLPRGAQAVIGTVAALRAEKNLSRLLEAFCLVREQMVCQLVIAGDGPERASLEARAKELGLSDHVTFTGHRMDTECIYASLDVFVLSSDTEQMPTSVLEAMAAGLPVVSTQVGDVKDMLAPENTQFVVSASANALAKGLLALLRQPTLGRQIGALNQARARQEFSEDKMFAAYGEILDSSARNHS